MKRSKDIIRVDHITKTVVYQGQFHIDYYPQRFPFVTTPHRHNYHEILWFPEGEGVHCIDDLCFNMTGNDLFLIAEGQMHYYKEVTHMQGYLLLFKDTFWDEALHSIRNLRTSLFNHLLINAHLRLCAEDAREISYLMDHIHKEYTKDDYPNKAEIINNYLQILLLRISNLQSGRQASPHATGNDYLLFNRFINLVESSFASKHNVAFYTEQLHVTSQKLAAVCRSCNSRNPKELIDDRILMAAKRELQFTAVPIKELADHLHFSDQYQFSKFFKKLSGTSPMEYRIRYAQTVATLQ